MHSFYSHGKLLITSEYFVLDGAKGLAFPTKKGQFLKVNESYKEGIYWKSFNHENKIWFETIFNKNLKPATASETSKTLQNILLQAQNLNPEFLNNNTGLAVETQLEFPNNWGLGSSSTLINNIAQWASVDAFKLLEKSFGGSGYDIAAAQNRTPITYKRTLNKPLVTPIKINWNFTDELFFVHLNRKQDTKQGIKQFRKQKISNTLLDEFSLLTDQFINAQQIDTFEKLIETHERLISKSIGISTVKETLFKHYPRAIKSLGAWGGDFILVAGNARDHQYFQNKGFQTIIKFKEMVL